MADVLLSVLEYPEREYLSFVRKLCGNDTIQYNESMAASEREYGYLNAAITNILKYHGNIENDIERVLRFYFRQCSIGMNCRELAHSFLPFADHTDRSVLMEPN